MGWKKEFGIDIAFPPKRKHRGIKKYEKIKNLYLLPEDKRMDKEAGTPCKGNPNYRKASSQRRRLISPHYLQYPRSDLLPEGKALYQRFGEQKRNLHQRVSPRQWAVGSIFPSGHNHPQLLSPKSRNYHQSPQTGGIRRYLSLICRALPLLLSYIGSLKVNNPSECRAVSLL